MARTALTSGGTADDVTRFTTATGSAPAKALVLLFVSSCRAGFSADPPSSPTVAFGGDAMRQVNTSTSAGRRLTCYQLTTVQAKAATFIIDFAAEQQDYCAWSAIAYDGVDLAAPVAQSRIGSSGTTAALTVTLDGTARNTTVGALILDNVAEVAPGPGLAEIHEVDSAQGFFARNATLETVDAQPLVEDVSWTWTTAASAAAIVVEVKAAPVSTGGGPVAPHPDEALIRRFEPILFLDAAEKFVPVNAKRFVEASSLWLCGTPPFDRATWGTPPPGGGVFPRAANATTLSTVANEPGTTYLASIDDTRLAFLELGGWNDKALSHESGVTESSSNTYADRDAIALRYETDLKDSRFWYHAEVFVGDRLPNIAMTSSAPDLRPLLEAIPNPALLCYYLFFPAHQQSVVCDGIGGTEVSSHAGDWQCVAILLEGDGSGAADRFKPRYVGMTGSRPAAGDDGFPAYEFDEDELTVMKVAPWRDGGPGETANPTTTADGDKRHPHVYVSSGSHSLYPTQGEHPVDPYPATALPHDCGGADSSSLSAPPPTLPSDFGPDKGSIEANLFGFGAFLGKIFGGASAGAAVGGLAGAIAGGYAGLASGVSEWVHAASTPFGVGGDTPDAPRPDATGSAGSPASGLVIKPANLSVAGATVVNWQVGQAVPVGTRTYDYVVDRRTQVWWPHDDGERGYRGRWGQRVTDDTLPRRSGPRFPNYPRMFLMALADLAGK